MFYTDNKDFYPTPKSLFRHLMDGTRYLGGRILEPSAGKGDMVTYIEELTGSRDSYYIDAIESDTRLVNTLIGQGIDVVWNDFLTYETYKEYDYIIMNPPFSNGVDHVLKAFELAENQLTSCVIYAILNKQTIDNAYSNKRQDLLRKLDEHKAKIRYVKHAFVHAERKTDVEVALINVIVEKKGAGKSIYDSIPFYASQDNKDDALSTALSTFVKDNEIADNLNDIERYVLEYETACEVTKEAYEAMRNKESFFSYIGSVNKREGDVSSPFSYVTSKEYTSNDLNSELDRIRSAYWALILDTDEFKELLTNEAIAKLNRQMNAANRMEINLTNIKMLLIALGANRTNMLIESIVAIFERITRYHMNQYSTNIHYYDGWKTNDAYRINKKIIIPINGEFTSWDFSEEYGRINLDARNFIDDLVKAFQLIDPRFNNEFETISPQEFENELLRFRMFKNGNIHVWFNDLNALNKLNYICGQHFAWIPSEDEQEQDEEARRWVAEEFGDIGEVRLLQE